MGLMSSAMAAISSGPASQGSHLGFRINAVLNVDPIREAVSFDTAIDFESTAVHVKGSDY